MTFGKLMVGVFPSLRFRSQEPLGLAARSRIWARGAAVCAIDLALATGLLPRLMAAFLFCTAGVQGAPLNWQQRPGYRVANLDVPTTGRSGFTLMTPAQTGIWFTNYVSMERSFTNQALIEGAGVCAGDFDGDGLPDLYFCNLHGPNGLFRNLGGFKFQGVTAAGVECTNQVSRGAAFADINGDGWLDLIVTSLSGPNACLLNDGQGRFRDVTSEAGLVLRNAGCTSLALADIDGDGFLDLYIANSGLSSLAGESIAIGLVNGKPHVVGRAANRYRLVDGQLIPKGYPHAFYRNDGRGHFIPISWTDGTFLTAEGKPLKEPPADMGLSAMFRDLNGDGAPDLYVCNDWETPDRIWINDGKGHFRALPDRAIRKTCLFSMSVDFADINRDGYDDLFNADMVSRFHSLMLSQLGGTNPPAAYVGEAADREQSRRNTLQLNRGDGTYAEIANYAGVSASDWTWCVAFLDVDLDGYEDLLTVNGHLYDLQDRDARTGGRASSPMTLDPRTSPSLTNYPALNTPNYLFRNRGDCTFEEVGAAWGFNSTNACHGISLVDLDNDGDLDVVVSCIGKPPLVYRNESAAPRVAVRLKGNAPNTFGIGARIILRGGAVPYQSQEMICGGRYLSSDQPQRVFAAGSLTNQMNLEIKWRSGLRSLVSDVRANCMYEVAEAAAVAVTPVTEAQPACRFEDVSRALGHRHADPAWDDFSRQLLLPRRFSRLGPGVAWFDLNGDGMEDLIVGGGRATSLGVFLNGGNGNWTRLSGSVTNPLPDDSAGIVGGVLEPGRSTLFVGLARVENPATNSPGVMRFDWTQAGLVESSALPANEASVGPVMLGDVDGDGHLDLFAGGRLRPGRYPEPVPSRLFLNRGGKLVPDADTDSLLTKFGMVTGAVFCDLDGDGYPELVLATEWGSIRLFHNDHGRFRDWNVPLLLPHPAGGSAVLNLPAGASTLQDLVGLWTCVATGDFDGDGRMDIVAGNWGLNTSYQPFRGGPWFLYFGDFNDDGEVHVFEAYRDHDLDQIVPSRDLAFMEQDLPWLRAKFTTHKAYSHATMSEILDGRLANIKRLKAECLASVLFLNRGDKFEVRLLPPEAQWSPAMGLAVGDLDGDGNEDLFISQNCFAMRPEDSRLDAGRGLFLRGDGQGGFSAVPGQVSGIQVYGEQRGCALADYDADGRVDLVVTQNNDETRLFHNVGARAGLRVRLAGGSGNPQGIGASLRLESGDQLGPAREIQAGGGFWSQNSAVQVLGGPRQPTGVRVRWPGGKISHSAVPASAREIEIKPDGSLKVLR